MSKFRRGKVAGLGLVRSGLGILFLGVSLALMGCQSASTSPAPAALAPAIRQENRLLTTASIAVGTYTTTVDLEVSKAGVGVLSTYSGTWELELEGASNYWLRGYPNRSIISALVIQLN